MYTTKRISDSSYTDIQALYKLSFDIHEPISFIEKKYATEEFGQKNVGVLAIDTENNPAAYYGVFPIVMQYNSKDFLVAQSGDTMTSPNHRKKGLFTRLAKEAYDLAEDLGIKMVYGFPNENSFPGFKHKLNWVFAGEMQKFTIEVSSIPFCELSSKYKSLAPLYRSFVAKKIKRYEVSINDIDLSIFNNSNCLGLIKKDQNFFNYKMSNATTYLVQQDGFTLLIKTGPHLMIGDVGIIEESQCEALISSIKKISRGLGCKKAILTMSKNHWLYGFISKHIESKDSLPIGFFEIDKSINYKEIQFTGADYDTF